MDSESRIRTERIDPQLAAAGWTVGPFRRKYTEQLPDSYAVEEWPTSAGPADYALCDRGLLLGVIEAKKSALGPQGVLPQAERYSRAMSDGGTLYRGEFGTPFIYATNGEDIWFHDVRQPLNLSRRVKTFHTPSALREQLNRDFDQELTALGAIPIRAGIRSYQIEANAAIEQAITDRHRKFLVTMATGTGKTLMTVNQVYRLMKSGVARRVLFLVDRRALAAQTVREFASFEAEPGLKFDKIYPVYSQRFQRGDFAKDEKFDPNVMPNALLTEPKLGDAFVYVSTIQRMSINLFGRDAAVTNSDDEEADAGKLTIPIHAFDLIVADECHRGYSAKEVSVWRDTLDWFDGIKVGLTATPAAHTMAYFEKFIYRYDYETAVREGYLVDYDVVRIDSNVRMNGVFLEEGEQVDLVDPDTGARQLDLLEDERAFDASQVERSITAPDSNRKILEEIKRYADAHEAETGRFPKTLIFATNDLSHTSHADQLVALARDVFGRGEAFVAKITGRVDRPLQKIREFRNRPNPKIVVSVDMLTTGVDIPDLEYVVLLRPVKSRILFEQILGRGTRRSTDLLPPKTNFVVFDCFNGTLMEYFRKTTGMTDAAPEGDGKSIAQIIEDIWQNQDRGYNTRRLVKRLQRIDKNVSGDGRDLFSRFIPDGDVGRFAEDLPSALRNEFSATMKLLRNNDFQDLLKNFPRSKRTFIVASGAVDEVDSEWLIRGAAGAEYRPEDYLQLFEQFVGDHAEVIEAITILLTRPRDWGAEALSELREKLAQSPDHFTEVNLQRAYQVTHRKSLIDIISMVKRAARESSQLLTAEERVDAAIARVTVGRQFSDEQLKWLERIRHHMIKNLSIEPEDFSDIPLLADRGGWGRANQAFGGQLTALLGQLNEELVAA